MEDDPKYDWNLTPLGKDFRLHIQNSEGEFVPIGPIQASKTPHRIVCEPIPGRDGIHYVPDWYDLTHFG